MLGLARFGLAEFALGLLWFPKFALGLLWVPKVQIGFVATTVFRFVGPRFVGLLVCSATGFAASQFAGLLGSWPLGPHLN